MSRPLMVCVLHGDNTEGSWHSTLHSFTSGACSQQHAAYGQPKAARTASTNIPAPWSTTLGCCWFPSSPASASGGLRLQPHMHGVRAIETLRVTPASSTFSCMLDEVDAPVGVLVLVIVLV